MAETIETTPEITPEIIPENETIPEPESPAVEPAPKKRGRPKGAPDKAPRKKKITIVEEPIAPASDAQASKPEKAPSGVAKSAPTQPIPEPEPPKPEPEPPSPRSTLQAASQHILQLQHLRDSARKTHLQDMHTKNLHRLI